MAIRVVIMRKQSQYHCCLFMSLLICTHPWSASVNPAFRCALASHDNAVLLCFFRHCPSAQRQSVRLASRRNENMPSSSSLFLEQTRPATPPCFSASTNSQRLREESKSVESLVAVAPSVVRPRGP
ncbi:hypothetical protein K438DRAFT_882410 [Mycena galopus ATCC 62051]|nr:hypothetical protein K438DRAFT_882410 [Mycena galopus ATCC 62051]